MTSGSSSRPTPPLEPEELFRCETTRQDESAHIPAIGELDLDTTPILRAEIDALRSAGVRHLTLDLSGLDFIDSTGLRLALDCDADASSSSPTRERTCRSSTPDGDRPGAQAAPLPSDTRLLA